MKIPKIFTMVSGENITSIADWEKFRRHEILHLFETYVYGVRPEERPSDLSFETECVEDFQGTGVVHKKINIRFYGYSFPIRLFLPKNAKTPVPAFVYIMHEYQMKNYDLDTDPNPSVVPILNITERGYAVAIMPTLYIAYDWEHHDEYKSGVYSAFTSSKRNDSAWATISAWAWGASRVMDCLETDTDIDSKKVGVVGHSRGGKTALWCGATDKRFAYVVSNNSGCAGAAVTREKAGERIKDINITDWFCKNHLRYNEREELLPVDQHMLLALIAPRLLYVASSSEDTWADPLSELRACRLASEVYERYGISGVLLEDEAAKPNVPYHEGSIGYHVKGGKHSITPYDWQLFMDFADKHLLYKGSEHALV